MSTSESWKTNRHTTQ